MSERHWSDELRSAIGHRLAVRHLKPRLVFVLLVAGAFAGIWVAHYGDPVGVRVLWWSIIVTGGVLAGGLYWRLALFDATAFDDSEALQEVRDLWRRIETAAVWTLLVGGIVGLSLGEWGLGAGVGAVVLSVGLLYPAVLWLGMVRARARNERDRVRALRAVLFLVSLTMLAGFARVETGTGIVRWLVRFAHVSSFALWIGGAAWHNVIVVPSLSERTSVADVLKTQTRAFRRHLPIVVALILATGLFQAVQVIGTALPPLYGTQVGQLVLFKLLVFAVLTSMIVNGFRRARR